MKMTNMLVMFILFFSGFTEISLAESAPIARLALECRTNNESAHYSEYRFLFLGKGDAIRIYRHQIYDENDSDFMFGDFPQSTDKITVLKHAIDGDPRQPIGSFPHGFGKPHRLVEINFEGGVIVTGLNSTGKWRFISTTMDFVEQPLDILLQWSRSKISSWQANIDRTTGLATVTLTTYWDSRQRQVVSKDSPIEYTCIRDSVSQSQTLGVVDLAQKQELESFEAWIELHKNQKRLDLKF
jgi:hypothetical protein